MLMVKNTERVLLHGQMVRATAALGRTTKCTVSAFLNFQTVADMMANTRTIGRGIFTYADGRRKDGIWQNGK